MAGKKGFEIKSDSKVRKDAFLFGESQSRVVVSVSAAKESEFLSSLKKSGVAYSALGKVISERFVVDNEDILKTSDAADIYDNVLTSYLA